MPAVCRHARHLVRPRLVQLPRRRPLRADRRGAHALPGRAPRSSAPRSTDMGFPQRPGVTLGPKACREASVQYAGAATIEHGIDVRELLGARRLRGRLAGRRERAAQLHAADRGDHGGRSSPAARSRSCAVATTRFRSPESGHWRRSRRPPATRLPAHRCPSRHGRGARRDSPDTMASPISRVVEMPGVEPGERRHLRRPRAGQPARPRAARPRPRGSRDADERDRQARRRARDRGGSRHDLVRNRGRVRVARQRLDRPELRSGHHCARARRTHRSRAAARSPSRSGVAASRCSTSRSCRPTSTPAQSPLGSTTTWVVYVLSAYAAAIERGEGCPAPDETRSARPWPIIGPDDELRRRPAALGAALAEHGFDGWIAFGDDRAVYGPDHIRYLADIEPHFEPIFLAATTDSSGRRCC